MKPHKKVNIKRLLHKDQKAKSIITQGAYYSLQDM
jgi:hypothetical protein